VRGLLTQEKTSFDGEYFTLTDAQCEPKPVQERLPIWIGGGGEKVTLRIAARHADGWNVPFIAPDAYAHKVEVLTSHCEDAGRDPGSITKTVNAGLAWKQEDLEAQFGAIANFVSPGVLMGSVGEMTDKVAAYRDAGAEMLILAMRAPFDVDGLDKFATEVLPALT
jgi:alkanesulfonate monooxygenase SsuD/methylene tetrahydromethanopterin reductase-like flavin-dependent oxidoreductase (luciferase family)